MPNIIKIAIGIQARSTSRRFPNKVFAKIDGKTILKHVIDKCVITAMHAEKMPGKDRKHVSAFLLIPKNDPIKDHPDIRGVAIIEGPEQDVLARYVCLSRMTEADYVVRITADCPMVIGMAITRLITLACVNGYDYLSNVDERCRTAPDGMDCEIISKRMIEWLDVEAKEPSDREHVTPLLRNHPPHWARRGHMNGLLDLSHIKCSIDYPEEVQAVEQLFLAAKGKKKSAEEIYGKAHVHEFS